MLPDDLRAYEFVRHLAEVKGLPRDEAQIPCLATRSTSSASARNDSVPSGRCRPGNVNGSSSHRPSPPTPRFIVLDEPTDGLDPVQRDEMLSIIVEINRNYGIDVILSSHVLEEVERVCDHVVALDDGRLVAQGTMTELAGASGGIELELVDVHDHPTATRRRRRSTDRSRTRRRATEQQP